MSNWLGGREGDYIIMINGSIPIYLFVNALLVIPIKR